MKKKEKGPQNYTVGVRLICLKDFYMILQLLSILVMMVSILAAFHKNLLLKQQMKQSVNCHKLKKEMNILIFSWFL